MSKERWKLTIEYNGRDYCGWQRQQDGIPSIQKAIEDAIYGFCQQQITIHVAGRTDAGVHARGQIIHFDLDYGDRPLDGYNFIKALNAHLRPAPISIVHAVTVNPDFSARFDAVNKLYLYRIVNRPARPALENGLVWHVKRPLDVDAMRKAASCLLGYHDFTSFRDADCQAKSPFRTLDRIAIISHPYDDYGGADIRIEVEAQSFLHHQVRNMVGTLALVGEGKWQPGDVKTVLEACDRKAAGPTAPADGLYLMRVDYPTG